MKKNLCMWCFKEVEIKGATRCNRCFFLNLRGKYSKLEGIKKWHLARRKK